MATSRPSLDHLRRRPRRSAHRELERGYAALKTDTLRTVAAKLRARSLTCTHEDLEAAYNRAWQQCYDQLAAGVAIANVHGFLVQVTYRRALDELRRARTHTLVPLEAVAAKAVEDDVVQALDDRRRVREFVEGLAAELDERERVAASLCYVQGYSRGQAAQVLGVSDGRMKKVMDRASKTTTRLTREIEAGTRCTRRHSTNTALALGVLDPEGERSAAARAHLAECPGCRTDVRRTRERALHAA